MQWCRYKGIFPYLQLNHFRTDSVSVLYTNFVFKEGDGIPDLLLNVTANLKQRNELMYETNSSGASDGSSVKKL